MRRLIVLFGLVVLGCFVYDVIGGIDINVTGVSSVSKFFYGATFLYQLESEDRVSFAGDGTGVAACNIIGFWQTGNTNPNAPSLADRAADQALCANPGSLSPAQLAARRPIVDFAVLDTLPATAYQYFPDVGLIPAMAIATVPIYNIPEIKDLYPSEPLVLSRSSIALIYSGHIRYWNDSRILADNTGLVKAALQTVSAPIQVVVRYESNAASNAMAQALSSFSATFASEGSISTSPAWCGTLTDEIQIIRVSSCSSSQAITLRVVDPTWTPRTISFACDASAADVVQAYFTQGGTTVLVTKTPSSNGLSWDYQVGHSDSRLTTKNWYEALLVSAPSTTVQITTLQEGGFLNAHYAGTYKQTALTQSIFVKRGQSAFFDVTGTLSGVTTTTGLLNSTSATNLATSIRSLLSATWPNKVTSVTQFTKSGSPWVEYRVVFSGTIISLSTRAFPTAISNVSAAVPGVVYSAQLLEANGYPRYFVPFDKSGYLFTGQYTCYKRSLGYQPWTYYAGSLTDGSISLVMRIPYSISYSVLYDATAAGSGIVSLINQAGTVVAPTSSSLTFAAMEQGGNLDKKLQATMIDGKSALAWPISSFIYFAFRARSHIGDCDRRKAAMKFIYKFYFSDVIKARSTRMGNSPLPDFIRDIVIQRLVSTAMCSNGEYALASYRPITYEMVVPTEFYLVWQTYMDAFFAVNASLVWNLTQSEDSVSLWSKYSNHHQMYIGAVTLFSSRAEKVAAYADSNTLSVAFANVAMVILYNVPTLAAKSVTLRVTPDIIAGIFSGTIRFWNDTLLQQANWENKGYLPYIPITVVAHIHPSDASSLFIRYLAMNSPLFCQRFGIAPTFSRGIVDFAGAIPQKSFISVDTNLAVDYSVNYAINSVGFYLNANAPRSAIASFCHSVDCSTIISPANFGDKCESDPDTKVSGPGYDSLDLMVSTSPDCYPITGTVDYIMSLEPGQTADEREAAKSRVQLASWLFQSKTAVSPSSTFSITSTSTNLRSEAFSKVCNVPSVDGLALGYDYCSYRDCSWASNDFYQTVSPCDSVSATRIVNYSMQPGVLCQANNPQHPRPNNITIGCTYAPAASGVGITGYVFVAVGVSACIMYLFTVISNRKSSVIKRSQPIFIYIFIVGAIAMNLTIIVFVGPNTDTTCMLRPWLFNLTASIMFAPLIMKLRRVDKLVNNAKLMKLKITDLQVLLQVVGLISVDVILLILWSAIDPPRAIHIKKSYTSVLAPVDDVICSTKIQSTFEILMLTWKILLLLFGVKLAITTWKAPPELAEAKHFSVAIYNIAVLGGITYFLAIFLGESNATAAVILHCLGIFACSTAAVGVIITPKLLIIEGLVAPVFVYSSSSSKKNSESSNRFAEFLFSARSNRDADPQMAGEDASNSRTGQASSRKAVAKIEQPNGSPSFLPPSVASKASEGNSPSDRINEKSALNALDGSNLNRRANSGGSDIVEPSLNFGLFVRSARVEPEVMGLVDEHL